VQATDGTAETNALIKEQLLEIFKNSKHTGYTRSYSQGESFINIHQVNDSFGEQKGGIYIEALKENTHSHTINTFYPIVFFPQVPEHLKSENIKIASQISTLDDQPYELPYDQFCLIFKESLRIFIEHVDAHPGNPPNLKTPVRYKSNCQDTYIIDGAIGLQSHSPPLTDFFTEGFYGEFSSSEIDQRVTMKSKNTVDLRTP